MPFHKYLNAAKWKEYSFCGSFHSWFINSGVIQSSNTGDKLPKSKMGSFFPRSPLYYNTRVLNNACAGAFFFQCKLPTEASLCDGSLAIIASLTGYECRSGFGGLKRGVLLKRDLHCHLQPYLRRIALVMWPVSLLSQRMTLCHQFHVFPPHAITSYM